jgi:hypothetical protein
VPMAAALLRWNDLTELVLNQFQSVACANSLKAVRWSRNQPAPTGLVLAVAPETLDDR